MRVTFDGVPYMGERGVRGRSVSHGCITVSDAAVTVAVAQAAARTAERAAAGNAPSVERSEGAGEPAAQPAPEVAPEAPKASARQLRHQVMKTIGAVLQAREDYQATEHPRAIAHERLDGHTKRRELVERSFVPHHNAAYLESLFDRHAAEWRLELAAAGEWAQAAADQRAKAEAYSQSLLDLKNVSATAVEERPELADDDVLIAASQLRSDIYLPDVGDPVVLYEHCELSDSQRQRIAELREQIKESCKAVAAAMSLEALLSDCEEEITSLVDPSIKPPVNFSEEEIQRYLRQLEDFMLRRQKAHRRFRELFARKQSVQQQMNAALRASNEAYQQPLVFASNEVTHVPVEVTILRVQFDFLSSMLRQASGDLSAVGETTAQLPLDDRNVPEATEMDAKKIRQANKLLHELAVALARASQAESGCKRVSQAPEKVIDFSSLSTCGSWEECQQWWSKKQQEMKAVAGDNLIRSTRIKLATQTKDHFQKAVKNARTMIRRLLLSTPAYKPWCDELRALLNACAWTQKPAGASPDEKPGKPGRYPVY